MESLQGTQFRSIAEVVVPETATMNDAQWLAFYSVVDNALAKRPAKMVRQLKLFLKILNIISLIRYRRPLHRIDRSQRVKLLSSIEDSKILLFRRGFWG